MIRRLRETENNQRGWSDLKKDPGGVLITNSQLHQINYFSV